MIDTNKFQLLIAEGQLEKAISGLINDFNLHLTDDSSIAVEEMYNTVIQLSCRLKTISKKQNLGTIRADEFYLERNKLSQELLEFLVQVNASKSAFSEKRKIASEEADGETDLGFDFFLSFSSKDIIQVNKIASALRKEGFTVFASNDSLKSSVGKSYFDSIDYALHNSRNFLLLSTPNSSSSEWVKTEWQAYFNEVYSNNPDQRKIFVYRGNGFESGNLHFILKQFQNTDQVEDIIKVAKRSSQTNSKIGTADKIVASNTPNFNRGDMSVATGSPERVANLKQVRIGKNQSRSKWLLAGISIAVLICLWLFVYPSFKGDSNNGENDLVLADSSIVVPPEEEVNTDNVGTSPEDKSGTTSTNEDKTTSAEFRNSTIDFGTITEGEDVTKVFYFQNTGNKPLLISDVKSSCSCAVPSWPRESTAPGQSAKVSVKFFSKNKIGKRDQTITIVANTIPPVSFIYLTGTVVKKEPTTTSQPTSRPSRARGN